MGKELADNTTPLSANNQESLILYGSADSPCARRCRITLIEKGLDFDSVMIDLLNMEQRSEAYLALNPNGFVPTLSHGQHVVYESGVINEYLEEQFPEIPLMPKSPAKKAEVRMWMAAELAMAKTFRKIMYQRVQGPILHVSRTEQETTQITHRYTSDPQDIAWEKRVWHLDVLTPEEEKHEENKLLSWLDNVEVALVGQSYLVGNQFSQADISMYPRIMMYAMVGIRLPKDRYPNVLRWIGVLEKRPSFEASMSKEAKKNRKLATSPVLPKLRQTLAKSPDKRNIADKTFLYSIGKIIRKLQGVDALLSATTNERKLPLPREASSSITPKHIPRPSRDKKEDTITIYGHPLSPHSQRIQILAKQLNLQVIFNMVDLNAGMHLHPEFLKLNPHGEIPVIQHGDKVIYDSVVIAEYLLSTFDHGFQWRPMDSMSMSKMRMWLALESGTHKEFKPLWDRYVLKRSINPHGFISDEKSALERIEIKLALLEDTLKEHEFIGGKEANYADIVWYTRIYSMLSVDGFSPSSFNALEKWYQRVGTILVTKEKVDIALV